MNTWKHGGRIMRGGIVRRGYAFWLMRINAAIALAVIVAIVIFVRSVARREVDERAAWNEGRWGVDRAVAVAMAERGEGKTAREVLTTDHTDCTDCEVR